MSVCCLFLVIETCFVSHQQRCREEEKTGVCARAVEDVTCEWNIVVLRGNKK